VQSSLVIAARWGLGFAATALMIAGVAIAAGGHLSITMFKVADTGE
jgi:hypothetical protein